MKEKDSPRLPRKKREDRERHLQLRQVEVFVEAARQENFLAAAKKLGISTAYVSETIAALERSLGGVSLFERTNAGSKLTEAGVLLVEQGAKLLSDEATVREALADHLTRSQPRRVARVRVAYEPLLAGIVGNATVAVLETVELKVRVRKVEAIEADAHAVAGKVARGEADLGLTYLQPKVSDAVDSYPIATTPLVLIVSARGSLQYHNEYQLSVLGHKDLALPSRESENPGQRHLRKVIDEYLAEHKLEPRRVVFEGNTTASILAVVRGGSAVTINYAAALNEDICIWPNATLHNDLRAVSLVPRPQRDATVNALLRKGSQPSEGAYAFTGALIKINRLDAKDPLPDAERSQLEAPGDGDAIVVPEDE